MCCLQPPYVGHFPSAHKENVFKLQNNDVVAYELDYKLFRPTSSIKLSDNNSQVYYQSILRFFFKDIILIITNVMTVKYIL